MNCQSCGTSRAPKTRSRAASITARQSGGCGTITVEEDTTNGGNGGNGGNGTNGDNGTNGGTNGGNGGGVPTVAIIAVVGAGAAYALTR